MSDPAVEAVRVLPVAQAVDKRSQLMHVVHFARHHHLLMDDVGLRQVRPFLQKTNGSRNVVTDTNTVWGGCNHRISSTGAISASASIS